MLNEDSIFESGSANVTSLSSSSKQLQYRLPDILFRLRSHKRWLWCIGLNEDRFDWFGHPPCVLVYLEICSWSWLSSVVYYITINKVFTVMSLDSVMLVPCATVALCCFVIQEILDDSNLCKQWHIVDTTLQSLGRCILVNHDTKQQYWKCTNQQVGLPLALYGLLQRWNSVTEETAIKSF